MTPVDTERFRKLLVEERDRLQRAVQNLRDENPGSIEDETGEETHFDQHLADAATATFDRELDYTLEESAEATLASIDAALERIDRGEYGKCKVCGREIPEERLEALPWTELCIDDARRR